MRKTIHNSGQTIIELVAVMAIGTILILALVALSTRSNASADFSKANGQAAKLASEGVEILKNLKTLNSGIYYDSGCSSSYSTPTATNYTWITFYTTAGEVNDNCSVGGGNFGRKALINKTLPACTNPACLVIATNSYESITADNRIFQRVVYISDTPSDGSGNKSKCNTSAVDYTLIKQYTVVVSWSDSAGTHEATNATCLTAS